jgi:quercetin dioxygenase-like cupin family protein
MTDRAASEGLRVIHPDEWGDDIGLIEGGSWREVVGPAAGAECRGLYHLELAGGARSRRLSHSGEAVYYVVEGDVSVTEHRDAGDRSHELTEGGMAHVRPEARYSIASTYGASLVGGPSPVDPELGSETAGGPAPAANPPGITTHHRDRPGLLVPFISADARLVVWLGVGAVTANMNYVVLEPGERNKEHVHAFSEDTIHILAGHGTAENVTAGASVPFGPGDTIHIEIGVWHAIAADRGERVVSVGGPCPVDTNMLRAAGVDVDAIVAELALAWPLSR